MRTRLARLLAGLVALAAPAASTAVAQEWPATRAESSGFLETSSYLDVRTFLEALDGRHPLLHLSFFGYSEEGRALPLAIFGRVGSGSPAEVRASGRTRVLVFANIHAGEVAGKEAAQVLVRELAQGRHDDLADSLVVLVVPIYNADGNERVSLRNRPLQHGPFGGMGQRANARGLDLNRDNTKLESAEARALVRLVQDYDVHAAVDLHTTNGTLHAYQLTYSPPLHPSTDPAITRLLRSEWLPAVTEAVRRRHGWEFYYYGNVPGTFGMKGERGWYTFDYRPRYTTNYLGLANRFGILSEAYAYLPFEERILAHLRFVGETLAFAFANATRVREATAGAAAAAIPGMEVALRAEPVRGDSVRILMGGVVPERHPYTGEPVFRRRAVHTPERMPDYGTFRPTETIRAPVAYLVPPDLEQVIERLEAHGVRIARLDREATLAAEEFRVDSTRVLESEYQGHALREVWGAWQPGRYAASVGTVVVPVRQPLGRLIVLLLEPRSDDGFAAWNLLDGQLEATGPYPVVRIQRIPAEECAECGR